MTACWLYVVNVDTWLTFPSLPTNLAHFPMVTGQNGQPYVLGGYNTAGNIFNTVYGFKSNKWTELTPMPKALVATITGFAPVIKASCALTRSLLFMPP